MGKERFGYGELGIGVLVGALLGLGVGLLIAPQSGEKTRVQLSERASELKDSAQELFEKAQKSFNQLAAKFEEVFGLEEKGTRKKLGRIKDELKKYKLNEA